MKEKNQFYDRDRKVLHWLSYLLKVELGDDLRASLESGILLVQLMRDVVQLDEKSKLELKGIRIKKLIKQAIPKRYIRSSEEYSNSREKSNTRSRISFYLKLCKELGLHTFNPDAMLRDDGRDRFDTKNHKAVLVNLETIEKHIKKKKNKRFVKPKDFKSFDQVAELWPRVLFEKTGELKLLPKSDFAKDATAPELVAHVPEEVADDVTAAEEAVVAQKTAAHEPCSKTVADEKAAETAVKGVSAEKVADGKAAKTAVKEVSAEKVADGKAAKTAVKEVPAEKAAVADQQGRSRLNMSKKGKANSRRGWCCGCCA